MSNTRKITVAGGEFEVPMLPLRHNMVAYPICQKLHNEGFLERIIAGQGKVSCSAEEMQDLAEIVYIGVKASNDRITREEFDNWPISPAELVDAYFLIRYQTGAWVPVEGSPTAVKEPEGEDQGEATGEEALPT